MRRHLLEVAVVVVALAVATLLVTPRGAEAHAFLVRTTPQPGERLGAGPPSIDLQFSEPAISAAVSVKEASGVPVATGPAERLQDGLIARAGLPPLGSGIYVVSWQDLSVDGHASFGEFAFAVGTAGQLPATLTRSDSPIAWPEAAASWFFLVPLFVAFGGLASERFVWVPVSRRYKIAVPRLPIGSLLLLALLGNLLQLAFVAGQSASMARNSGAVRSLASLLASRGGLLSLGQLAFVVLSLGLLRVRRARIWVLPLLTAVLAAAALRGHPGTSPIWWAEPANIVHLLAAALWIGGLGHLVFVFWQKHGEGEPLALAEGARRYATLALGLVALVMSSGVLDALAQVTALTDLIATSYGQVLLVKLLFVAGTLGVAYAARRTALPSSSDPAPRRRLVRLTRAEGVLVLTVVATATVLANAPPPSALAATEDLLGPPPLVEPALHQATVSGLLAIYLDAGNGELRVRVLAPSDESAEGVQVTIDGLSPDGREFDVAPRPCGPGCVTSTFSWERGTTTLAIGVLTKTWGNGNASFSVTWPPQPEDLSLLDHVIKAMGAQSHIALSERVSPNAKGAVEDNFSLSGEQFLAGETYTAGGASDVRPVAAPTGYRALAFYVSGSSIWYYLEIDSQDRLVRETVVDPGHLIERTFQYDAPRPGSPSA